MPEEVQSVAAVEAPAPIPATAPEPVTETPSSSEKVLARTDLSEADRVRAFKAARHKERFPDQKAAAPAPRVVEKPATEHEPEPEPTDPTPPPVAAAAAPPRQLSKSQIATNDAIRKAVDNATAELQREVARLKGVVEPPRVAAAPVVTEDLEPDPTNAEAYPDGQFDSKFIKDLSSWQTRKDLRAHTEQQALSDRQRDTMQTFQRQAEKTQGIVKAAVAADPKALEGVDPAIFGLRPTIDLQPGESSTFGNVIADWIIDTDFPVELAKHLSDRAEVSRLANLSPREFLKEQGRIEARFVKPAPTDTTAAPAPPAKPVTEARDPAHTLGSKPVESPDPIEGAMREKNFTAYQQAKRAKGVLHYAG